MKRVPTGILGLDELLGGGLPTGKTILVSGVPGSGKTILCIQYLYHGITDHNEPGVYVTLDESPVSVAENMLAFGMDLQALVIKGLLVMIDASPIRSAVSVENEGLQNLLPEFSVTTLVGQIRSMVKKIGARRLAIDPLTAFLIQYRDDFERRIEVMKLFNSLTDLKCTSIMTSELLRRNRLDIEQFASDGIIILDLLEASGNLVPVIQVLKLRGVKHDRNFHPYEISDKGLRIFPREVVFSK